MNGSARVLVNTRWCKSCKSGLLLCVSFPRSLSLIFDFMFFVNLILCDKVQQLWATKIPLVHTRTLNNSANCTFYSKNENRNGALGVFTSSMFLYLVILLDLRNCHNILACVAVHWFHSWVLAIGLFKCCDLNF